MENPQEYIKKIRKFWNLKEFSWRSLPGNYIHIISQIGPNVALHLNHYKTGVSANGYCFELNLPMYYPDMGDTYDIGCLYCYLDGDVGFEADPLNSGEEEAFAPYYEAFRSKWEDVFRRNCYLLGCSVSCTAHEQIEWNIWLRECNDR